MACDMMGLGIFIWRPPWSLEKLKSVVDVLGVICQASLLHLTEAVVSRLNLHPNYHRP